MSEGNAELEEYHHLVFNMDKPTLFSECLSTFRMLQAEREQVKALEEQLQNHKMYKVTPTCGACYTNKPTTDVADLINHPPHYTSHPSGIECIEVTRHMNFNIGNAIKYLWRHGQKPTDSSLSDLRKARWYIDDEIKRIEQTPATQEK